MTNPKRNEALAQNSILQRLTAADLATVLEDGRVVTFELRETVYAAESTINEVYFPLTSVLSVVTDLNDGMMVEIGTIGREGMTDAPLVLGSETTANRSFCQVHGLAWEMTAPTFRRLLEKSKLFRELVNRYLQAYVNILGQFTACNRVHTVYERASRWILMTQDRVDGDTFPLTHEFLATMLGSRRSRVTIAAAQLQRAGFIKYHRGSITVLDRAGLEATACECYEVTTRQFGELLRPSAARGDERGDGKAQSP